MSHGFAYLIHNLNTRDQARIMSRSLYEGNLQFLIEAEGDDAELEKLMPKAVASTLKTFTDLAGIAALKNAQELARLLNAVKGKIAKHTTSPETPEALKDFKTAEELHATIVKIIDRYTASLVAKEKSGGNPNQRAGILRDIISKSVAEATAQITQQISGNSILKKAFSAITKSGDLEKRVNELTKMNLQDALNSISNLSYDDVKKVVLDPKFKEQRDVQGQVVSEPPKNLPSGTEGGQAAENQEGEEGPQFDNNQKKLIDKVGERKDDLRKLYDYYAKTGEIKKDKAPIVRKVLDQFTDDPKETYSNLQNNLGPKARAFLGELMKFAGEKFEDLDAELAEMEESGEASAKGSEKDLKTVSDVFNRMKDLRKAIDRRVADEEITEKEGDTLQVLLDKLEKIGKEGDLSGFINDLSPKSKQLVDDNILGDAKEGWTRLDTDLRAIKKSAPKVQVDFGVSLDDLEKLVRDVLDAPVSKSMKAVQDEFVQGLVDAGSDEDKYTAAFEKLEKMGGSLENSKGLRLIGLDKLASEREGEAGQEEESASAGKSLSSILFNSDSSVKKKLDPGGEKIKSSLASLNTALADYTSNKGGKKNKTALVTAIKGVQDSLKGVKLEGASTNENVIVERWQKLAGLL